MKVANVLKMASAIGVSLVTLAGCGSANSNSTSGSGSTNTSNSAQTASSKPVTITFWDIYDTGASKTLYANLISNFEKQNPNIHVQVLSIDFFDYWTKLSTAMAAGTGPDLAMDDNNTVASRADSGAIVNLTPFIKKDNFDLNNFYPVLIKNMKYNGDIYSLPLDTDVRVLYYNKTLFKQAGLNPNDPPTNWTQLAADAKKLTTWNKNGMLNTIGFAPTLGNTGFWMYAWANGGSFFDQNGNPTIDTPQNIQTMQWMKQVQSIYGTKAMAAYNEQAGAMKYSPFVAGKEAMVIDNNSLYGEIQQYNPKLNFGVAAIPYQSNPTSWSDGFSLEILSHKSAAETEASWKLMKYLLSEKAQFQIAKDTTDLVSNKTASQNPQLMKDPVWKTFVNTMSVSKFRPYIAADPTWYNAVTSEVNAALADKESPTKALQAAQKQVQVAINNYNAEHK